MDINLPLSPPVNNNIQTSIHDRLDAIVLERIRVANTQLDTRLSLQDKLIEKYRRDVEKVHTQQTRRLKREVKKIRQKKPNYIFDDSDISISKSRITAEGSQRCLSEPPSNLSYCRRYYSHHYNVTDTSRVDKKAPSGKKTGSNDFFNLKMRMYFLNVMTHAYHNTHLQDDPPIEYRHSFRDTNTADYNSLDQSRLSQFFAQTSIDEDNDSVFDNSHSNFKRAEETSRYKLEHRNNAEQAVSTDQYGDSVSRQQYHNSESRERQTDRVVRMCEHDGDNETATIDESKEHMLVADNDNQNCRSHHNDEHVRVADHSSNAEYSNDSYVRTNRSDRDNNAEYTQDSYVRINAADHGNNNDRSRATASESRVNIPCIRLRGYQRRNRDRKGPRRSMSGSNSEDVNQQIEAEQRKSKHAFEKIFAGLV